MGQDKKISIIIPVYNVRKYLDECVQSVCNQTYSNLEIILVDDGSPDDCGMLCDQWAEKDSRIIVIHKENGGVSAARNSGLDIATGDYIGFVDSDDIIHPDMFSSLLKRMTKDQSDLVVCAIRAVDETGTPFSQKYEDIPDCILSMNQYISKKYENDNNRGILVTAGNRLYKKEIFDRLRFKEKCIHEDEYFLNELIGTVNTISIINNALYDYRQISGSIMHSTFNVQRVNQFYATEQRISKIIEVGLGNQSLHSTAIESMRLGMRFWLLLNSLDVLYQTDIDRIYSLTMNVNKEYNRYAPTKIKIGMFAMKHTPKLMISAYNFYRHQIKKK